MEITLTDQAVQFFEKDMGLKEGQAVRFTSKVYGKTNIHEGLSVMTQLAQPKRPLITTQINGVTYFAEEADAWFYSGNSLNVEYNPNKESILFRFENPA